MNSCMCHRVYYVLYVAFGLAPNVRNISLLFQSQTPTFLDKLLNRVLTPIKWLVTSKIFLKLLHVFVHRLHVTDFGGELFPPVCTLSRLMKSLYVCKYVCFACMQGKWSRLMTKSTKWHVHPAKTQISQSDQSLRCQHEESLGP